MEMHLQEQKEEVGGEWCKIKSAPFICRDQWLETTVMMIMKRGSGGFGETISGFRAGLEG